MSTSDSLLNFVIHSNLVKKLKVGTWYFFNLKKHLTDSCETWLRIRGKALNLLYLFI